MTQKSRQSKRVHFPKWLLLFLVFGALWGVYRFYPRQSAGIFVVTAPTEDGSTTLTGVIRKDTAIGEEGRYYLVTEDGKSIMLDIEEADTMVGSTVQVSGYLSAPFTDTDLPYMVVSSMESQ